MQSVTLKIRKKANYPVQRLLKNIFLMNYAPFKRSQKRRGVLINACDVFRCLNPSYGFRKAVDFLKNVPVSSHLLYLNLTLYCSVYIPYKK